MAENLLQSIKNKAKASTTDKLQKASTIIDPDLKQRVMSSQKKISVVTEYKIVLCEALWEGYFEYEFEKTGLDKYKDPWTYDSFTDEILLEYTFHRIGIIKPVVSDVPQISTLNNDMKHIRLAAQRKHSLHLPDILFNKYRERLFALVEEGLLDNSGKQKKVITMEDIRHAIKHNLLEDIVRRESAFTIQIASLLLMAFYTGLRPASLVSPHRWASDIWRPLLWKDLKLFRHGENDNGDILHANMVISHLRNKDHVISKADHLFERTVSSPVNNADTMDLALLLMCLASTRGFAKVSVCDWLVSDAIIFDINEENLNTPVFCMSTNEGHHSKLTTQPWVTTNANHALHTFFKKSDVRDHGLNFYGFRRNFTHIVQQHQDAPNSNLLTAHESTSTVQHKHYANPFNKLDLAKLMTEGVFTNYTDVNAYILGNMSLANYSERRLTADEYNDQVKSKVTAESYNLKLLKTALENKHGSPLEEHWDQLEEDEKQGFMKLKKMLTNKKVRLSMEAQKAKLNKIHETRLTSLTKSDLPSPAENLEFQVINEDEDDLAVATVTSHMTRLNMARQLMEFDGVVPGSNDCPLCVEDETITKVVNCEGHVELVEHLVKSHKSPQWNDKRYTYGPQNQLHTEASIFRRQYAFEQLDQETKKCPVIGCKFEFKGDTVTRKAYNRHLGKKHLSKIKNLSIDQVFNHVREIMLFNFQTRFSRQQFDECIEKWRTPNKGKQKEVPTDDDESSEEATPGPSTSTKAPTQKRRTRSSTSSVSEGSSRKRSNRSLSISSTSSANEVISIVTPDVTSTLIDRLLSKSSTGTDTSKVNITGQIIQHSESSSSSLSTSSR